MATMLKCAAGNLRCRLVSSRGFSHQVAIPAPLGKMMDCITGPQFVLPESNNGSQENPKIELPSPYISGSMELMAVPRRKVGYDTVVRRLIYCSLIFSWVLRGFFFLIWLV